MLSTASPSLPFSQAGETQVAKNERGWKTGWIYKARRVEQLCGGTSAARETDQRAPPEAQQVLQPGHHGELGAAAGKQLREKQPGILLGKELEGRQQQERPAKAGNGTRGCGGTSKISPLLKTLLSMPVFRGFVNRILYVTSM